MDKNLSQSNSALQSIQNSSQNEIILYRPNDTISLEVRLENETVWLTQQQIAELFERDRTVIGRHIKNCFKEGELDPKVVCANFAHTTQHGAIANKTQLKDLGKKLCAVSLLSCIDADEMIGNFYILIFNSYATKTKIS